MRKWLLQALALVLLVGLSLGGVIAVGRLAHVDLREQRRYQLDFADISCEPPPGLSRAHFLDEVQYLTSFPGTLDLLDPNLAERLAAGFGRHPWVARVERVEVVPPRLVRLTLAYRKPVLAVPLHGQVRVVDGRGVLLPKAASADGLPVYVGTAPPPAGPAGSRWGDAAVEAAARAARQP
jgi:hypothetical protein